MAVAVQERACATDVTSNGTRSMSRLRSKQLQCVPELSHAECWVVCRFADTVGRDQQQLSVPVSNLVGDAAEAQMIPTCGVEQQDWWQMTGGRVTSQTQERLDGEDRNQTPHFPLLCYYYYFNKLLLQSVQCSKAAEPVFSNVNVFPWWPSCGVNVPWMLMLSTPLTRPGCQSRSLLTWIQLMKYL